MKKVNKILLGSVLPFLGLSVAVPVIATSCSVTPATIIPAQWDSNVELIEGFSLNSNKDELIFDARVDADATKGKIDLEGIKEIIFKKTTDDNSTLTTEISDNIKNTIVGFKGSGWTISLEKETENKNDKTTIFEFLLSRKDGLEISRLKIIAKNYLINGTWERNTDTILPGISHLSNDGKTLNIDLSNIKATDTLKWEGLDNSKQKSDVKAKLVNSNDNNNLIDKYKNLIDFKKDAYDSFKISDGSSVAGQTIEFNITLSKTNARNLLNSQTSENPILKIIVKNTQWN